MGEGFNDDDYGDDIFEKLVFICIIIGLYPINLGYLKEFYSQIPYLKINLNQTKTTKLIYIL